MDAKTLNPYEPPAPALGHVVHHFGWRSASTTLRVGEQEQHEVTVKLDLLTARTTIVLDGRVERAFRYFFDPPPVRMEVGDAERHQVEVVLVSSLIRRPSHIDVDGKTVVPEIAPQLAFFVRFGTILVPALVAGCVAFSCLDPWMRGDWFATLLIRLMIALVVLLFAFLAVVECGGLLRMKRDQPQHG